MITHLSKLRSRSWVQPSTHGSWTLFGTSPLSEKAELSVTLSPTRSNYANDSSDFIVSLETQFSIRLSEVEQLSKLLEFMVELESALRYRISTLKSAESASPDNPSSDKEQ